MSFFKGILCCILVDFSAYDVVLIVYISSKREAKVLFFFFFFRLDLRGSAVALLVDKPRTFFHFTQQTNEELIRNSLYLRVAKRSNPLGVWGKEIKTVRGRTWPRCSGADSARKKRHGWRAEGIKRMTALWNTRRVQMRLMRRLFFLRCIELHALSRWNLTSPLPRSLFVHGVQSMTPDSESCFEKDRIAHVMSSFACLLHCKRCTVRDC